MKKPAPGPRPSSPAKRPLPAAPVPPGADASDSTAPPSPPLAADGWPIKPPPPPQPDWVPEGSTAAAEHARVDRENGVSRGAADKIAYERKRAALRARHEALRETAPLPETEGPDTGPLHPGLAAAFAADPTSPAEPANPLPPTGRLDQMAWHIARLEALADPDGPGWTGFSRRLFLSVLAATGKVSEACAQTGLARAGAYALRARDRLFAAGWDAAAAIARAELADRLMEQAFDGLTDTVTRADGSVLTRHRHDTRLSIAVLTRLDRRCDRAEAAPDHHRGIEANWDAFLVAVGTSDDAAAAALAAPPPLAPDEPPLSHDESLENAPVCPHCPADPLDPAAADGDHDADDEPDEEGIDLSQRVWTDQDDNIVTDFAPPPGFDGFESETWPDPDYYRTLTPDETRAYEVLQATWAAEDEAELAEERTGDERLRRIFFGLDEEAEAEPSDLPESPEEPARARKKGRRD